VPLQNSFDTRIKLYDFDDTAIRTIYGPDQSFATHQQKADLRSPFLFKDFHKARMSATRIIAKFFYRNIEIFRQFGARIGIACMLFQLDSMDIMLRHFEFLSYFAGGNTPF